MKHRPQTHSYLPTIAFVGVFFSQVASAAVVGFWNFNSDSQTGGASGVIDTSGNGYHLFSFTNIVEPAEVYSPDECPLQFFDVDGGNTAPDAMTNDVYIDDFENDASFDPAALLDNPRLNTGAVFFPRDVHGDHLLADEFTLEMFIKTNYVVSDTTVNTLAPEVLFFQGENSLYFQLIMNEGNDGKLRLAGFSQDADGNGNPGFLSLDLLDGDLNVINIADGEWHYIVARYSNITDQWSLTALHEDLTTDSANAALPGDLFKGSPSSQNLNAFIGQGEFESRTFNGLIDEMRFSNDLVVDANLIANMPEGVSFTFLADPVGTGSVLGGGTYVDGAEVTITALPQNGYEFIGWSGDLVSEGSNNPVVRTAVLGSDLSATAVFQADLSDPDGDGLTTFEEEGPGGTGTSSINPDTDGDGVWDGDEVSVGADPNADDSGLINFVANLDATLEQMQLTPNGDDFDLVIKLEESTGLPSFSDFDITSSNVVVDTVADTITFTIDGSDPSKFVRVSGN